MLNILKIKFFALMIQFFIYKMIKSKFLFVLNKKFLNYSFLFLK